MHNRLIRLDDNDDNTITILKILEILTVSTLSKHTVKLVSFIVLTKLNNGCHAWILRNERLDKIHFGTLNE